MTAIQDGWQDVQVEDWSKPSGIWFLLQIPVLMADKMANMFKLKIDASLVVFGFSCKSLSWMLE